MEKMGVSRAFRTIAAPIIVAAGMCAAASPALGQADDRSIFVSNNGNLEGSITSLHVSDEDELVFVDRIVTGERRSLSKPCPGCNAYVISISPDGRHLATGHPSGDTPTQQVTILEVAPDATLTILAAFVMPSSILELEWVTDQYLAVARTSFGTNQVRMFEFDPAGPTLVQIDAEDTGSFTTSIAVDPLKRFIFAQDSTGRDIHSFAINTDGTLDHIQTLDSAGVFPLGLGIGPDGEKLYGGGGISGGGNAIVGVTIDTSDGTMSLMPGVPYTSPGASPKQVVVSSDGTIAIVGHGTDATVRTFDIDGKTGILDATGSSFDVGLQGSLGEIASAGDLVFFTDNTTALDGMMGVYSFRLDTDGSLTQQGTIIDTQGIAPRSVAIWLPSDCIADIDGSGDVGFSDMLAVLTAWGDCPAPCPEDLDGNGAVDFTDLLQLLSDWGPC